MKNIFFTLIVLMFSGTAFSQAKTVKKKTDIKISIPGLGADNKISRAALEKIDTLVLAGPNSGDYRITSVVFSVVVKGNLKEWISSGLEVSKTFKFLVKSFIEKKYFIDSIHIMNYKTKEEFTIPSVKMFVTD